MEIWSKIRKSSSVQIDPGPEVIKLFFVLNSVEDEILNAHKYNISRKSAFLAQISLECYFPLINVKMPTFVAILTFMSWKNFILS